MVRAQQSGALITICCLLLINVPSAAAFNVGSSVCNSLYNLSSLGNVTVASQEVQAPNGKSLLFISDILEAALNSSSRGETAARLGVPTPCMDYLDFTLPEVSIFLLNTSHFNQVTFDEVLSGVFVAKVEAILDHLFTLKSVIFPIFNLVGNETLHELALSNNLSVGNESIAKILLKPFNLPDFTIVAVILRVPSSAFDFLNQPTTEVAPVLAVENRDELNNYTLLRFAKVSFLAAEFFSGLQMTVRKVRDSLNVSWIELRLFVSDKNMTSVLEIVSAKIPKHVRYLTAYILGFTHQDLRLLNISLREISELTNRTVVELQEYRVYPELVTFIVDIRVKIIKIDLDTRKEIGGAIRDILGAYNVTFTQLSETFNLTLVEIHSLSPFKIELLSARLTLIRYTSNLNLSLAEVASKVNMTEADLSYNLTVTEFHVVIRKLVIVRTFEIMSQMLGVRQSFLVSSLNINAPVFNLSLCEIDGHLKTVRQTVLTTSVVIRKSLAFAVQTHGFSVTFVRKLTIEQLIIRVMRLSVHDLFGFKVLNYTYSPERLKILQKYDFSYLERLFQIHEDIPNYPFSIFRYSIVWIINRIIFLVETDVDECFHGTDKCHSLSQCIDLPGTYKCLCPPQGFSGRYCDDINECTDGSAVCPMGSNCVNTPGSYKCVCRSGFLHNPTNSTCDDIDECDNIFDNFCFWGGLQCINTVGSYVCSCPAGFFYSFFFRHCFDINECNSNKCSDIDEKAICVNYPGSFDCRCRSGFEPYYNNSVSPRVLFNCTDVDECARGANCPENSVCVNTIGGFECRCLPGYKFSRGKCRVKRFVPFNLLWIIRIKTRKYVKVSIPSGFPYFGKLHKKIYICHNGLVSMGKKYCRANPKKLKSLRKDVVAVFWANTDITVQSDIKYQPVDGSTTEFRKQLDNISDVIKNCSGATDFTATWMLIITWERVSPYARFFSFNPYDNEQSTYQLVLATNGTSSYAVYSYEDGGMQWTRRLRRKCAVGYATKNGEYSYQEDDSFSENIFGIDSKEFLVNGVTRSGFFCKSLNAPSAPLVLTNEQKCMDWYNNDPDPDSWLEELTDCPSTRRHIRRDNRYKKRRSRHKDVECYELKFPTRKFDASQQCCYSKKRGRKRDAFVSDSPEGGRAYRYHYRYDSLRKISDEEPFDYCCSAGSSLCSLFYEKRPLSTAATVPERPPRCSCLTVFSCLFGCNQRPRRRRPFRRFFRAWFFGDPHISTLDGLQYTFNGLGDYVLIRTLDNSLHLHGRTERPVSNEGELSNATVFSGFVLKTNTSDTAQIFFDDSMPGNLSITVILQNKSCSRHSIDYFDEGRDFMDMSIERSSVNNNTIIVSFPSGFSIEVTPGIRLLQITVNANGDMMNNTQGLLGKFNGDKSDDLQYPNGTAIPANATEKEVFALGQKWRVPDEERLFVFSNCTIQDVFFEKDFTPYFFNPYAVTPEITALCGDNRECIYDVLTTGNEDLGKESAGFEEENQNLVNELANNPPEIRGPAEVNVTLNQTTEFYITSSDPDNDNVTLEIDILPPGAKFVSATGHFEWTPINATNITIEFVATDSKNASSILTVIINMCKCENNGECDFTQFVGESTGPFRVVECNCSDQFEGTFCETEVLNPCADEPCYDNVTCFPQTNPYGFQCGPCPSGLTGNGQDCFENDECTNASLSRCNQTCVNTFGSFRCECRHGFITQDEGRICEDINECQEAGNLRHNCTENASCMNLPGSFNCSCNPGYEGDPYSNCTDKNECTNGEALCSQTCVNTPGSFACSCEQGFQLSGNQATCEDIDECSSVHNCERICENVIGSYECRCPVGLELNADNTTCKVASGSTCDGTNGGCSQICVNRTGLITCYCDPGYNLTNDGKMCADINECMTGKNDCNQKCFNNGGSYSCGCHPGYQLDEDGKTCIDVDECSIPALNNCSQICTNNVGSYQCSCDDGFTLHSDNTSCADTNECNGSPPDIVCSDRLCINIPGSFQCQCPQPLIYARGRCRGTRLFTLSLTLGLWSGRAVVWKETFLDKMSLDFGFLARGIERNLNQFFSRGKLSREFLRGTVRKFRRGSVIADVDLHFAENATDITPDALRNELPQSGQIGNLTYDPQAARISVVAWLDFDECASPETHNCLENANCQNKDGSFVCKCKDGYQGDGKTSCEPAPDVAAPDGDKSKTVIIICAVVFGCLLLAVILVFFCRSRSRRYKAQFDDSKRSVHMTTRSANSDVHFYTEDKERTGSYDVTPHKGPTNKESQRSSMSSGGYDFPDPYPDGKRTTYYDNPVVNDSQL